MPRCPSNLGPSDATALASLTPQVQQLAATNATSQQQIHQMYSTNQAVQQQMQQLLAHLSPSAQPPSHPPVPPPPQPAPAPPQPAPSAPVPLALPPGPIPGGSTGPSPMAAPGALPLSSNIPGMSLTSYFTDVKPVLLLVITKHELDLGQLFKIDPQMKDRPKDAHLQLSDMGILVKAERDGSPKEYPSFRSLHDPLHIYFTSIMHQLIASGRTDNLVELSMAQASTSQVCKNSTLSTNGPRLWNTTSNSITGMSLRCRRGHTQVGALSMGTLCLCTFSGTPSQGP